MSAIALRLAGDGSEAKRLADDLRKRFPEGTVVQLNYLPTIETGNALQNHNAKNAIEVLVPAAPYELREPETLNFDLYPMYVRGGAFLAAHQGNAAVAEFQNIIDHPGLVLNEPIGALAHLQVRRA